ncbi:hypothetical protein GCM10029992_05340 [Glycomyces albus]
MVVSDRYIDSSIAYQGSGRGLGKDEVAWVSAWATGGLKPDLTVVLDVDPEIGVGRAKAGGDGDRLERERLDFHERVRRTFLDLAGDDPKRYLVVEAGGTPTRSPRPSATRSPSGSTSAPRPPHRHRLARPRPRGRGPLELRRRGGR